MSNKQPHIVAENVTLAYGTNIIQRGLNFTIKRGDNRVLTICDKLVAKINR